MRGSEKEKGVLLRGERKRRLGLIEKGGGGEVCGRRWKKKEKKKKDFKK